MQDMLFVDFENGGLGIHNSTSVMFIKALLLLFLKSQTEDARSDSVTDSY
jgi:hypothetical protein